MATWMSAVPDQSSLHPDRAALDQAVAAHQAGRLADAEALYLRFLRIFPDHSGANHNLGILFAQKGQADLGIPYLKRASELAPGEVHHWISYAEALFAADRPADASRVLETARSRGLAGPALQQAWARMGSGPDAETARLLQDALKLHQGGQLEGAAGAYRKVLALQPALA